MDYVRTGAQNFVGYDDLGNSNIFFPLTIDLVWIRGYGGSHVNEPRAISLQVRYKFHD